MLGACAIAWHSRLQTFTSLSSTEAEYKAAAELAIGVRDDNADPLPVGKRISKVYALAKNMVNLLSLRSILEEMGFPQERLAPKGSPLFEDNRGAFCAQNNPINKNLRHINRRVHRIRQAVSSNQIQPFMVRTHEMIADMFTKNLGDKMFLEARDVVLGYNEDPKPGLPTWVQDLTGFNTREQRDQAKI